MVNAFDCDSMIITRGNIIMHLATKQKETVETIDKEGEVLTCESGRHIGFEQLKRNWKKQ